MCIPKKNERVLYVEGMKLYSSFFLCHYTPLHFWKKGSLLDPMLIEKVTCLMTLQREVLGWCKWFFSTIEEEREKNEV